MTQQYYALEYSGIIDDYRDFAIDPDQGLFASKEVAQRHADKLNTKIKERNEQAIAEHHEKAMTEYRRRAAEHEALVNAGLRTGPFRENPPTRWAPALGQGLWRVSEPFEVREDDAPAAEVS